MNAAHRSRRPGLIAIVLTLALSGCGTLFDSFSAGDPAIGKLPSGELRVYGGVRWDVEIIAEGGWLFLLDLPFSAAFDTVMLPVTVIYNLAKD